MTSPRTPYLLAFVLAAGACASPEDESSFEQALTAAQRKARMELIRDSAAEMGVYNGALLAGIAVSETNFAHCWSEATWACQGPDSPSCEGGPVIAGASDGPCSQEQGGLGMFQFDSGTYAQTLATYGDRILTVEGNTAQAVAFVVERLRQEITGVDDWLAAVEYMNNVPMSSSDPLAIEWGEFLGCRYNGCCASTTTCNTRSAKYRDNAIDVYNEMGADFWHTADRCKAIPDDGIIDQRSLCYLAGGEPRYWRRETTGYGDTSEWTGTTTGAAKSNFARWLLRPTQPIRAKLEAYVQASTATKAVYRIAHGGIVDSVTIDQTTAAGWVVLGEFALEATGDEYVELADNTGIASQQLRFDALRITDLDGGGGGSGSGSGDGGDGEEGGCSTGRSTGSLGLAVLGLFAAVRRRRR
ncbi:MAG: hypothetical protein SFX73_11990 [Kofleriaceae bacterium]|nr:hypothetical protein [Kofleriaceae bacterium]